MENLAQLVDNEKFFQLYEKIVQLKLKSSDGKNTSLIQPITTFGVVDSKTHAGVYFPPMRKTFFCLFALLLPSFATAELFFSPLMISGHIKDYNAEEKAAIQKDLTCVRSVCLGQEPSNEERKPVYLATAGGPGARKTTILERFLAAHPQFSSAAYLDPDQRALKFMLHTYYSQSLSAVAIAKHPDFVHAQKAAYEKWRGASNYITLTLLEEAFATKRDIVHGATSTGEHIFNFLSKVKEAGYEIVFLLCSAEDSFRQKAIEYRNEQQKLYQSTPEDAVVKGKVFPLRTPAYFTYADTLYIYWSDDLETTERLAAVLKEGKLQVLDEEAYRRFVEKFERDRALLIREGKRLLSWEELLQTYQRRFLNDV